MTNILCIETATEVCSVAVSIDGKCASIRHTTDQNSHSERLTVFVNEVLNEASLSLTDLNAVAISMGPGSYTGLRIGTSAAKGFCFGLNIPLIAISTLQAIANGAKPFVNEAETIVPMIDARRMEVYSTWFSSMLHQQKEIEAVIVDQEYLEALSSDRQFVMCGNGAAKCAQLLLPHEHARIVDIACSSAYMCDLAYQKFICHEFENVAYFEPFYLKEFIAAKSHVKGLR
jgi:tRNA threonylcarbamoyladenosine biosynthesis protein TsaB